MGVVDVLPHTVENLHEQTEFQYDCTVNPHIFGLYVTKGRTEAVWESTLAILIGKPTPSFVIKECTHELGGSN